MYLHDILKRLLAKACLDASFMCLSRFDVFRITFNGLCCWLLSRLHLSLMDQSWQTGPNEPVLHLKVVFAVC